jgi:hypothetical protein
MERESVDPQVEEPQRAAYIVKATVELTWLEHVDLLIIPTVTVVPPSIELKRHPKGLEDLEGS